MPFVHLIYVNDLRLDSSSSNKNYPLAADKFIEYLVAVNLHTQ